MSNSYTDKYNIIKTFKNDEYQTVLIGSNKENIDDVVVINILHKDKISKITSKSHLSNGLNGLLDLEDKNEDLIIVTEYNDGTPLESYLKYSNTTIKHKINLAYEYMTRITKYDIFHNSIKNLLVDESQIMIKDDMLYFNELLFLDENFSEITEFNTVASKIAQALEIILFSSKSAEDKDNDLIADRILKLINQLKNHEHQFQSIEDIYSSFRNIYIYDLFMEDSYKSENETTDAQKSLSDIDEIENNNSAPQTENNLVGIYGIEDNALPQDEDTTADSYEIEDDALPQDKDTPADSYGIEDDALPQDKDTPADSYGIEDNALPQDEDTPADSYEIEDNALPQDEDTPADSYETEDNALHQDEDTPADSYETEDNALPQDEDTPANSYETEDNALPQDEDTPANSYETEDNALPQDEDTPANSYETENNTLSQTENNAADIFEKKDDEEIEINLVVDEDPLSSSDNSDADSEDANSYNLYLNDLDANDEEENYHSHGKRKRKKNNSYSPKLVIGLIIVAILLIAALYKPILNVFNAPETTQAAKPKAYFVFEKIANTYVFTNKSEIFGEGNAFSEISWKIYKGDSLVNEKNIENQFEYRFKDEGEYKVVLSIKDKFGNSDEYSENIIYTQKIEIDELKNNEDSIEKLDNLKLKYSDTSIIKDYKAFRSGNYSLMLGEKGKTNSEKLIIDNINIKNKPTISMWTASSLKENIKVSVKGYKNDSLQFEKIVSFTPSEVNTWEIIEISDTAKNINRVEMVFSNFTSPIWVDDIEINSYK